MFEWFRIGFGLGIGIIGAVLATFLVLGLIDTVVTSIRFAFFRRQLKASQAEGIVKE
ncbi:MAG: hypothetical protein JRI66_12240 [Deltaproteobacteria bacterium]|nr:hypothetical protein [Deltaproteobacteria bacterium]